MIAAGIVLSTLIIGFGYSRQTEYERQAKDYTTENAWHANNDVKYRCVPLPPLGERNCTIQARREQRDYERHEQDLYAQRTTALWTFLMGSAAIFGVVLSVVGVWLVYITYRNSRETAERELRPYVLFTGIRVEEGDGVWKFAFDVINNGQTPARLLTAEIGCQPIGTVAAADFKPVALQKAPEGTPIIPKDGTASFTVSLGKRQAAEAASSDTCVIAAVLCKISYRGVIDADATKRFSEKGRAVIHHRRLAQNILQADEWETEISEEPRVCHDHVT
jgi:hypothetical protein